MTNAEIIATIRNEIERLKKKENELIENSTKKYGAYPASSDIMLIAYQNVLSFLSTLESEKPLQEGLEEEISNYTSEHFFGSQTQGFFSSRTHGDIDCVDIVLVARHFAQWGYLRAAEKYDEIEYNRQRAEEECLASPGKTSSGSSEIPNDQPLPEDTVLFNKGVAEGRRLAEEEQADLFTIVALDAAQRAKEQMMKEAVEGVVMDFSSNKPRPQVAVYVDPNKYCTGDKVRIIIVKED